MERSRVQDLLCHSVHHVRHPCPPLSLFEASPQSRHTDCLNSRTNPRVISSSRMRRMHAFAALVLLLADLGQAAAAPMPLNAARHQTNFVDGWTVLVDERLLAEQQAATEKALELLRGQLNEIVREVPAPAVAKLQEVTLWFSPEYPGVKPRAEYHPDAPWLRDHGRN